jgi:pimeloyl-ACP methyl ester carboxylesterase
MTTTSPAPERTTSVATRLGALHVRIVGSGRTTVLWPSMFVDSHTWDRMLPLLTPDRRYVLVDGPGLGLSEPLRRTSNISEAADAAGDLLEGLSVDEPVDWVGNAFGGHVGFKLATRPGVLRSLVAVSAPTEPIAPALRRSILLLRPILRTIGVVGPVRAAILDAMLTEASQADEGVRQVVLDSLARPGRASMSAALSSFILQRVDVNDELGDICVPSLFVASDDRGDWNPEDAVAAAARTPGARATSVSGARTLVPLEQPTALAALLHDFWAERRD